MEKRKLVIGDTHGAYLGLEQALTRANYDPAGDRLFVLGDTFDGWPEPARILEFYRRIGHGLVYVLGNHDVAFIEWVDTLFQVHPFLEHGARATLRCYLPHDRELAQLHRNWLAAQRAFYLDETNRLYVHAGYAPTLPFGDQGQLRGKQYWWNRDFWQGMYQGRNYAKEFTEVFIGHTPTTRYPPHRPLPMQRRNVWNVDTGAGFAGCVTVLDVETKQAYQSELIPTLYPGHQGRH
jgi:serine/threonine protein phosphatase 1